MVSQNIIHRDESQAYIVKADLHKLTLYELAHKMKLYIPNSMPMTQRQNIPQQKLHDILNRYNKEALVLLNKPLIECFQ